MMNKRGQGDFGFYFQRVWQADLTGETNHIFQDLFAYLRGWIFFNPLYLCEYKYIPNGTTYSIQLYLFVSTANS